ncbi:hypothetical protein quinque_001120 [Culex quinquefasciatus]
MFTRFDANKSTKGASKLRRDLINSEIANLRDLLPLPQSTRQRLSQLQLMALVCVYVRKANYFQQVTKTPAQGRLYSDVAAVKSLLPGFLNRPLSETDSCQMTPLGKPVGGKQSPPDKPEVPVEPMEAAMEQSEGLTSPPSALQVQLVESPVFRPNLEPEGTPDQGKQPDQEGKW